MTADPVRIRLMTFNIEYEDGLSDERLDAVAAVIRAARADVVGLQEAGGRIDRLAERLGWRYDRPGNVVSRFPLLRRDPRPAAPVLVEVEPGLGLALVNVHLDHLEYGPELLAGGEQAVRVLEIERARRGAEIDALLAGVVADRRSAIPVAVTGDFNSASHTDRPELRWPATAALEEAGFADAYRVAHPDPAATPGHTWPAERPPTSGWNPAPDDPHDRIDFVWIAGGVVEAAEVVGEPGAAVDIAAAPWPSDHRAVVASLELRPGAFPPLACPEHGRYEAGAPALIRCRGVGTATVGGRSIAPDQAGNLVVDTAALAPGWVEVSAAAAPPAGFWVVAPGSPPRIAVERGAVRWQDAPGNRADWVGIYAEERDDPGADERLAWAYTGATVAGSWDPGSLPAGRWVAVLCRDDTFEVLARSAPFTG